ncbi:MAG: type 2 lanthipeptide synthetase LanM family protein [Chthoniobacter sp.]|uniref:type 2 lanthipeptide synthetase LanM family protein n=1 Tax=Chthoniobacter sp. TaxID=2510640 RepID=UPI0032A5A48B
MNSHELTAGISAEVALRIANLAATPAERLEKTAQKGIGPCVADPRLEVWKKHAAGGDNAAFRRQLEWDGLTEDQVHRALQRNDAITELPEWARLLITLPLGSREYFETHSLAPDLAEAPAFAPCLEPFVEAARTKLGIPDEEALALLAPSAWIALQWHLLAGLSQLASSALYHEFRRTVGGSDATSPPGRERFLRYVSSLQEAEPLEEFLLAYPVLARLLCRQILTWVETTRELLARLRYDQGLLASFFEQANAGLGRVEHLQMSLSDRHNGGRQVAILTFENGRKLVYKPKDVSLEGAYNRVLQWLKKNGAQDAPPAIRALHRGPYGWVEFIAQEPAVDEDNVRAYYRQAGALLCVMYALEGSDCHMDNVVATARGPVLVDLESLLQPRLKAWSTKSESGGAFEIAAKVLNNTVLNIGLLPLWQRGRDGGLHDVGGLGGVGGYESQYQRLIWQDVNTDAMQPAQQHDTEPQGHNVLLLDGAVQNPADYLGELIAGFAGLYRFLCEHRDAFLAEAFVFLKGCPARLIFRPSQHYALLMREARNTRHLHDGLERSLVFERLCGAFARATERPYLWPLVRVEKKALEDLDVPFFSMPTDSVDLVLPDGEKVPGCCERSSYDSSREILLQFSDTDMNKQAELIRASFTPPTHLPEVAVSNPPDAVEQVLATIRPLSSDDFIMAAASLARAIAGRAIIGKEGFATWVAPSHWQPDVHGQRGVSYYLYDGASGIALFLAALTKVTGNEQLLPLIGAACRPVGTILKHPDAAQMLAEEGIGGCSGLASVLYSFVCIYRLVDDPSYLEAARRIARVITDEKIMADQVLDVQGGSAGTILALLALHAVATDADVLRRAEKCGEHLLVKRVAGPQGGTAWKSQPEGTRLAGFAHGASGIAYALTKLSVATKRDDFLQAAREAIVYERTIYDAEARNWPVLPPPGSRIRPLLVNAWCHGAPGVALARLGCLDAMDDPNVREDLDIALDTTVRGGITTLDHLCCGNMGRIEIALLASRSLASERLRHIASVGATAVVLRAKRAGAYTLQTQPEQNAAFQPGFFRGLAGIGYQLLRVAKPEALPSILAFEPPL